MELLNCGVCLFQALDEQIGDEAGGRDPHIPSLPLHRLLQSIGQREVHLNDPLAKPMPFGINLRIVLGHILSGISIFGRLT